ncbi:MAG TPA: RNA polymerase sigma factor [Thermodesulfobacteriota bacterium]|nr:RNA polymerase sigma factor [Thermodesulfobacteriota bacterium]
MDSKDALNQYLAGVERKAFSMARFASGNPEEALDLVQEAMLHFVRSYSHRPPEEWNALFYRILHSRITDWHRRTTFRKRFLGWLGAPERRDEDEDPIQQAPDPKPSTPLDCVLRREQGHELEKAIRRLPLRQKQAFLLRAWEGMNVAETARAMGCSEGSTKTHYSRALHSLRHLLEDFCDESPAGGAAASRKSQDPSGREGGEP